MNCSIQVLQADSRFPYENFPLWRQRNCSPFAQKQFVAKKDLQRENLLR